MKISVFLLSDFYSDSSRHFFDDTSSTFKQNLIRFAVKSRALEKSKKIVHSGSKQKALCSLLCLSDCFVRAAQ